MTLSYYQVFLIIFTVGLICIGVVIWSDELEKKGTIEKTEQVSEIKLEWRSDERAEYFESKFADTEKLNTDLREIISQQPEFIFMDYEPYPQMQEDIGEIVEVLRGETFADHFDDIREVCKVILNRVSHGWGDVHKVVSSGAFAGYGKPSRYATEMDYLIAREVYEEWLSGYCAPFNPSYLYFGSNSQYSKETGNHKFYLDYILKEEQ